MPSPVILALASMLTYSYVGANQYRIMSWQFPLRRCTSQLLWSSLTTLPACLIHHCHQQTDRHWHGETYFEEDEAGRVGRMGRVAGRWMRRGQETMSGSGRGGKGRDRRKIKRWGQGENRGKKGRRCVADMEGKWGNGIYLLSCEASRADSCLCVHYRAGVCCC